MASKAMKDGLKVSAKDIESAASAVSAIKSIDETIAWMGRDYDNEATNWGKDIRSTFGGNRLNKMTDKKIGIVTLCSIINALLDEREYIVEEWSALVEFSDPPCEPMDYRKIVGPPKSVG